MRILLVADLHYSLRQFDWVLAAAGDYDAVVLAGDSLNIASDVPIEAQIVAVQATVAELAKRAPVFICSGNHDLNALSAAGEKTADWLAVLRSPEVAVDGDSVALKDALIGEVLITVLPWWDGPAAQSDVNGLLEQVGAARKGVWVWVYHSPPEGPLSWTGSRHYGDPVLAQWIERHQPDIVLCGHIHQAPFTPDGSWVSHVGATWLFNPGKHLGDMPPSVALDLGGATARWVSLAGTEERALTTLGELQQSGTS